MKLEKWHYVPKELISSMVIQEAAKLVFSEAGFKDQGPSYSNFATTKGEKLSVTDNGRIVWSITLGTAPLTLQELFTAENGIKWPKWANEIRCNDSCVWFSGEGKGVILAGKGAIKGHLENFKVLATRQQPLSDEITQAREQFAKLPTALQDYLEEPFNGWVKKQTDKIVEAEKERIKLVNLATSVISENQDVDPIYALIRAGWRPM